MGVKAEPSPAGLNREAGVVVRQIAVADEGVGRLDIGYASELELLGQSVLQRMERPLRASTRLGRIGADMLDSELLERPPDLGRMAAIDLAASFRGVKVMRPAIGVEAHRQAVLREHLLERPEGRGRALLLDEKGRIDRPRRVIHA